MLPNFIFVGAIVPSVVLALFLEIPFVLLVRLLGAPTKVNSVPELLRSCSGVPSTSPPSVIVLGSVGVAVVTGVVAAGTLVGTCTGFGEPPMLTLNEALFTP